MTANGWLQIAPFAGVILALTRPLGAYLVRVYDGSFTVLRPFERFIYRACRIDPTEDQHWTCYASSLLLFSVVSMLLTYLVLRLQHWLPLNPAAMPSLPARQAFETSASFSTNTNWQSYAGETTMSYFSQATQLAFHNFGSAASGMAAAVALTRGIARHSAGRLGNFWVDLVRGTGYVFLPLSLIMALVLVQQGAIQNLAHYVTVSTLEGGRQVLAMGPVASQEAIKQIGTNGGGFFNANSAHPFENPTPWSNLWQLVAIFAIPAATTWMFGRMVGHQAHGWALWCAMFTLFAGGVTVAYAAEAAGNPIHAARGVDVHASPINPGGNMEGKEVRFGIATSALFAIVTTDASCGAVNAMHDSFTPIGGLVPMVNMQLGEVVFGGVGAGLYGIVMMVILTVFIAGLMVGRTPEYLGKKIRAREVQMAMLYALVFAGAVLVFTAIAASAPPGLRGLNNAGPHGLSELLYAYSSTAANNGSGFAGLATSTPFFNTTLGINMLIGRFAMMVPMLALAGFLSEQEATTAAVGTFPLASPLFVVLLIGVILIVAGLTFVPALALGPIVEHLVMLHGGLF